ncbi:GDT1-like protein 2 [Morus notabilis]|uniref:GDT1 family protein n=1 Tax=Morus notabilis TaxID=981085 RepID=W9R5Z9_9ROSA|nr:GDT1-like protein 2 [Morus notabilis]
MQEHANKKCRAVTFEVGDLVFLKLQPYRHRALARVMNEKLAPHYYGPFQILARVGPVAYQLQLPSHARIHPVFHISRLKKALGSVDIPQSLPPILSEDLTLQVEPDQVLDTRFSPTTGSLEVLIKCRHLPDFESSWELFDVIQRQFPAFHLEDKETLLRGAVLLGSMGALSLMTVLSVVIGRIFHSVPAQFQTTLPIGEYAAVTLLLFFGLKAIKDAWDLPSNVDKTGDNSSPELDEFVVAEELVKEKVSKRLSNPLEVVWKSFSLVFFAEWGDRSMLATIALGAAQSPWGVASGAIAGHLLATLIAIIGGAFLANYISEKLPHFLEFCRRIYESLRSQSEDVGAWITRDSTIYIK